MPPENNQNFNQPMPQQPQKSGSALNVILLILLIALVGFGIWFLLQKEEDIVIEDKDVLEGETFSATEVWDFVLSNESKRCESTSDWTSSKDSIYVAQNKIRTEIRDSENGLADNFVIMDGKNEYWWNSKNNSGVKTPIIINLEDLVRDMKVGGREFGFGAQSGQFFLCVDWQEDVSLFSPPSNINFESQAVDLSYGDKEQQNKFSTFGISGQVYFDNNGSYLGWCNTITQSQSEYMYTCRDSKDKYIIFTKLRSGKIYCTDIAGAKIEHDSEPVGLSCE